MVFFLGAAQSLAILAFVGEFSGREAATGAALIAPMVLGFLASGPLRRYLDGGKVRTAVLVVAAASAVALIAQSLAT